MRRSNAKRSTVATITTLSIVALLLVSMTVAFLTDTRSTLNFLNIGNGDDNGGGGGRKSVQVALLEREFGSLPNADALEYTEGLAGEYTQVTLSDLLPGDEVNKDSTVKNAGTSDIYVRIALTDKNGVEIDKNQGAYRYLDFEVSTDWTQHADGYFYYTGNSNDACEVLASDAEVAVFKAKGNGTIKISDDIDNNSLTDLEDKIDIKVTVDAIQARNFEPGAVSGSQSPWGDEEIIATNNRWNGTN